MRERECESERVCESVCVSMSKWVLVYQRKRERERERERESVCVRGERRER